MCTVVPNSCVGFLCLVRGRRSATFRQPCHAELLLQPIDRLQLVEAHQRDAKGDEVKLHSIGGDDEEGARLAALHIHCPLVSLAKHFRGRGAGGRGGERELGSSSPLPSPSPSQYHPNALEGPNIGNKKTALCTHAGPGTAHMPPTQSGKQHSTALRCGAPAQPSSQTSREQLRRPPI